MRSLICFVFLMSASICMLAVTPVQASADGDTDNLTARLSDNSDSVLADSVIADDNAGADDTLLDGASDGIDDGKQVFDDLADDNIKALAEAEKHMSDLKADIVTLEGKETPQDVIKDLSGPDPKDYKTTEEWEVAANEFIIKLQSVEAGAKWEIAKENANELASKKASVKKWETRIKTMKEAIDKIAKAKEGHCKLHG